MRTKLQARAAMRSQIFYPAQQRAYTLRIARKGRGKLKQQQSSSEATRNKNKNKQQRLDRQPQIAKTEDDTSSHFVLVR